MPSCFGDEESSYNNDGLVIIILTFVTHVPADSVITEGDDPRCSIHALGAGYTRFESSDHDRRGHAERCSLCIKMSTQFMPTCRCSSLPQCLIYFPNQILRLSVGS